MFVFVNYPDKIYSVCVYGETSDKRINKLAGEQAKRLSMRPGYFGMDVK